MKDEIKKLLDEIGYYQHIHENLTLNSKELDILVDYIINLKQSDIDKQLEIMKLKDKLEKQRKEYQDTYKDVRIEIKEKNATIINLQEENKKIKHDLEQMYNDTKDTYNEICAEQIDYKSRCDKAIEYIKEHTLYSFDLYDKDDVSSYFEKASPKDLLNILQGENNDRRNME